jgi:ATP-dependent exoDNAse (exonuclease V) alpha subunit
MTQAEALDTLKLGHNIYITGAAGSGKTYLLNKYIAYLNEHGADIGITASTGIAATHMGGVTIHSWTGLGVRSHINEYDLESLQEKQYLWKRMEKVKVLIIDEVSMLHHYRLDMVDKVLKAFKRNDAPFGGIQVILCGDFFQLPPVSRAGEELSRFVYHSNAWKNGNFKICYLEEQFRQSDDVALRVLNDIREARVDEGTMNHLRKSFVTEKDVSIEQGGILVKPTRLYTHNIDVDSINAKELDHIAGDEITYEMETKGGEVLVDILKKSCLAPEFLRLRVGAKVMFVKNNFEAGFANGTLGVVKELEGFSGGPVVETLNGTTIEVPLETWTIEEDGKVKAELRQYPLRLAWAITVHKSQGMSMDAVEVDLSKSFEKGMGYVALSRVRTMAGLTILGFNQEALEIDGEVLVYDKQLRRQSQEALRQLYELKENGLLEERQRKFISSIGSPRKEKVEKVSTFQKTLELLKEKLPLKDMAAARKMTEETILNHVERLVDERRIALSDVEYLKKILSKKKYEDIEAALHHSYSEHDDWRLGPVKYALGQKVSYKEIQLVRIFVKK